MEDEGVQCSFQPNVKGSTNILKGEKASQRPLHERLQEIQKQKQEYLFRLKTEAEISNPDLTFQPRLDPITEQIAIQKIGQADVTDRLVKDAHDKVYKRMKAAEDYQNEVARSCTFKPDINPISKANDEILEQNEIYKYTKDFVTRQNILAQVSKERFDKKVTKILEEENCTFNPKISKISEFLVEADPDRANETAGQRIDRLSKKVFE